MKQWNFNEVLAVLLGVLVLPGIWIGLGFGMISLPGEVVGATISIETLIANYFFRKSPPKKNVT